MTEKQIMNLQNVYAYGFNLLCLFGADLLLTDAQRKKSCHKKPIYLYIWLSAAVCASYTGKKLAHKQCLNRSIYGLKRQTQ